VEIKKGSCEWQFVGNDFFPLSGGNLERTSFFRKTKRNRKAWERGSSHLDPIANNGAKKRRARNSGRNGAFCGKRKKPGHEATWPKPRSMVRWNEAGWKLVALRATIWGNWRDAVAIFQHRGRVCRGKSAAIPVGTMIRAAQ